MRNFLALSFVISLVACEGLDRGGLGVTMKGGSYSKNKPAPEATMAKAPVQMPNLVAPQLWISDPESSRSYSFYSANTTVPYPTPTVMPTGLNLPIALDVMPNGNNPTEQPPYGVAWIHVCDSGGGPAVCAYLGIGNKNVAVGSMAFNKAPKPTVLMSNNIPGLTVEPTGDVIFNGVPRFAVGTENPCVKGITKTIRIGVNGLPGAWFATVCQ